MMKVGKVRREGRALVGWIALLVIPLIGYTLVEVLNYNNPWTSFSFLQVVLNLIWYYLITGVLYLIIGRRKLTAGVALTLFWLIGMANRYVIAFRGRTIFPADLLTLGTALNVAGDYNYTMSQTQVITLVVWLACLIVLAVLPHEHGRKKPNWRVTIPIAVAAVAYIAVFFGTDFLSHLKISPSMWTTRGNGFFLNFTVCLRYSRVEKPDGYAPEVLDEIEDSLPEEAPSDVTRPTNLIVIMNEALSDFSVLDGVTTNEDTMPFYHSLTENTIKGYAYSSVFGGTTANSEYEFLTGNTTAFLPAGTVPYHLYVKEGASSLVGQMKALGYRTVAMHPYYQSGWNRVAVYRDFGFDEAYFIGDFQDVDYIRGYVSDRSNYENVIRMVEEKEEGEPLFLFNITMQNHSGYNQPWTGLEQTVWLTGDWENRYGTVDQYLSLVRESDAALQELIEYFEEVEEPTMIVLFGDHQPQVATNFYEEVLGGEASEVEASTLQARQKVPYLIWTNYDSGHNGEQRDLSLNYLAAFVAQEAGVPLTAYQRFLLEGFEALPVINTVGYIDAAGTSTSDESMLTEEAQAFLKRYRIVQYNNLFDSKGRRAAFFDPAGTGKNS